MTTYTLIDPHTKTVCAVAIDVDAGNPLRSFCAVIGADYAQMVRLDSEGSYLIVDEEGLLKPNKFFRIKGTDYDPGYPFAGKAVVVRCENEGEEDERLEPHFADAEHVGAHVTWPTDEEVNAFAATGRYNTLLTTFEGGKPKTEVLAEIKPEILP